MTSPVTFVKVFNTIRKDLFCRRYFSQETTGSVVVQVPRRKYFSRWRSTRCISTVLHLMGLDHERLTYRFNARDFRLTDVSGEVLQAVLA